MSHCPFLSFSPGFSTRSVSCPTSQPGSMAAAPRHCCCPSRGPFVMGLGKGPGRTLQGGGALPRTDGMLRLTPFIAHRLEPGYLDSVLSPFTVGSEPSSHLVHYSTSQVNRECLFHCFCLRLCLFHIHTFLKLYSNMGHLPGFLKVSQLIFFSVGVKIYSFFFRVKHTL